MNAQSDHPLPRRTLLATAGLLGTGVVLAGSSPAVASTAAWSDPALDALAFVTPGMSTADVAALVCGSDAQARKAYELFVRRHAPRLAPREQLRLVIHRGSGGASQSSAEGAEQLALPVVIAILGRALIAAVKRFGPAMYRSLVTAVRGGYARFNQWVKDHPFASGIIGAATYDVFKWLVENL